MTRHVLHALAVILAAVLAGAAVALAAVLLFAFLAVVYGGHS